MQTTSLDALVDPARAERKLRERLDAEDPEACWPWPGAKDASGYGLIAVKLAGYGDRYGWRSTRTHRLMWHLVNGPIPDGMVLDHSCLVRACCNPAHLSVVTQAENQRLQLERNPPSAQCPKCGASDWGKSGNQRRCRPCWRAYKLRRREGLPD